MKKTFALLFSSLLSTQAFAVVVDTSLWTVENSPSRGNSGFIWNSI